MSPPLTAIAARWTVLPHPHGTLEAVEGATVLVRGTRVVDVVHGSVGADRRIELDQGIAIPGFVNLHNHSVNGPIFRGIVDDLDRQSATDGLVYGVLLPLGDLAARLWSEEDVRAVYRLAVVELLRSGVTTVLDMPRAAHEGIFAAAKELGIRLLAAPYVFSTPTRGLDEHGRPDYIEVDENDSLADALRLAERHDEGPDGLVRVGLGPHATDTCSPQLMRRIAHEARDRDTIASIHVAQSQHEVETVRQRHGIRPVELLRDAGLLGERTVAAHCVLVEDGDLALLRDSGTTVANCPLTFARSGVSVSFDRFHREGVRTGIGTDGYCFDYLAELRAAGFVSKLTSGEAGAGDARTLLRAATEVGASALPWSKLGRLERGWLADLVVVDLSGPHVQPVRDPLKNLVWNATPADISLVMVNGRIVLEGGKLQGVDEQAVVRSATAAVEQLWEKAEQQGVLA